MSELELGKSILPVQHCPTILFIKLKSDRFRATYSHRVDSRVQVSTERIVASSLRMYVFNYVYLPIEELRGSRGKRRSIT